MGKLLPGSIILLFLLLAGCGIFPREINLGPVYRHRLDDSGRMLEMDLLWPLFKYQKHDNDGWEFRIRPIYRKVQQGKSEAHEFLWPLGRAAIAEDEQLLRLLPLLYWRSRLNEKGAVEKDWLFLPPFFLGGASDDGEDYFACWPLYGRIPSFLTYDEAGWFLFPLFTWSKKRDARTWSTLFPLISHGWTIGDQKGPEYWRFLPFYSRAERPGEAIHQSVMWPLVNWGQENMNGKDPRDYWFIFPLAGAKTSHSGDFHDWTALWPIIRCRHNNPDSVRWDGPWPLFRYVDEKVGPGQKRFKQWYLTPLYSATDSEKLWSRMVLMPIFSQREFRSPGHERDDTWILPFYWQSETRLANSPTRKTKVLFPLISHVATGEDTTCTRFPDPFPWRLERGSSYREFYDFLWNIYTVHRNPKTLSVETPANLFCYHRTEERTTWSIPFLFNMEKDQKGKRVLRLFQFFPISWGTNKKEGGKD